MNVIKNDTKNVSEYTRLAQHAHYLEGQIEKAKQLLARKKKVKRLMLKLHDLNETIRRDCTDE